MKGRRIKNRKGPKVRYKRHPLLPQRFAAITLPPFGIWIDPKRRGDIELLEHEVVHWEQYCRYGVIGFYVRYTLGFIRAGFSYSKNWMEREAEERTRG